MHLLTPMQKIIAIDCDEVVANTIDSIFTFNGHTFNWLPIQRDDITTFFWHEIPKFAANAEYVQAYRDDFFLSPEAMHIAPLSWAKQWVQALYDLWYDLKIVTSRWQGIEQMTREWIEQHFPGLFSDVVFWSATIHNHHLTNKADLMRYIGATSLVDDGLHNCLQVSAWWYETLLFDNPWNQTEMHIPGMKRVKDWQEIIAHFST